MIYEVPLNLLAESSMVHIWFIYSYETQNAIILVAQIQKLQVYSKEGGVKENMIDVTKYPVFF